VALLVLGQRRQRPLVDVLNGQTSIALDVTFIIRLDGGAADQHQHHH